MAIPDKLEALLTRLTDEQRRLITSAAECAALPAAGTMRRIADLELTIAAVGEMIAEAESVGTEG